MLFAATRQQIEEAGSATVRRITCSWYLASSEHSGVNGRAAVVVTAISGPKKVMVERSMYWNKRGAGTDSIGGFAD